MLGDSVLTTNIAYNNLALFVILSTLPSKLMPPERQHLEDGVSGLLSATKRFVNAASAYEWNPIEGHEAFRQVMFRAILGKQHESLENINELVASHRGYVAVTLLRPMCEELIWVNYLVSLSEEDAGLLLSALAPIDIRQTFLAQKKYAESKQMGNLGFSPAFEENLQQSAAHAATKLKLLASTLGWPKNMRGDVPPVKFLAEATGRSAMYDLLYHATSRAVHFSVPELMRRVWGRPGQMTIGSNTYERYWADFSLYWGGWIYSQVFIEIVQVLAQVNYEIPESELAKFQRSAELLVSRGGIPILTVEEVSWPFE